MPTRCSTVASGVRVVPLQQQLPRERRAVQRPPAQHLVHPAILADAGTRPERVTLASRVDKWGSSGLQWGEVG